MPRRDDDSGEYTRPHKSWSPLWLWLIGGATVAGCGVIAVLGLAFWMSMRVVPNGAPAVVAGEGGGGGGLLPPTQTKRQYTREEFRKRLLGKTESEVVEAVGKPDDTSDSGRTKMWTYRDCTSDTVTGGPDSFAFVHFTGGRVEAVNFS